jgi:hypothetical protein
MRVGNLLDGRAIANTKYPSLGVISNDVVHSESLGKNGRCQTNRSVREEAPSEASS